MVSTIIPVFNRPEMLKRAVQSVLDQTYRSIEVIIVDGGATDSTPDVARQLVQRVVSSPNELGQLIIFGRA